MYVVEPRGNSVFADAPLPFEPQIAVMDAQHDYPAEDRNDLLAMSPQGELATVDTGNNQFAYRFPGVLLGALTAMLIYLLARFLFKRRTIAVVVAILVLTDGMFFANSRIAMNDTYVDFFIVAAFTLFVPFWLGRWRKPWQTASVLACRRCPARSRARLEVGRRVRHRRQLACSSCCRSSLGRWIALAAMIALTGVLGYIAITPNPTVAEPPDQLPVPGHHDRADAAARDRHHDPTDAHVARRVPLRRGRAVTRRCDSRSSTPPTDSSPDRRPRPVPLLPPTRILAIGLVGIALGLAVAGVGWYLGRRGRGPLASAETVAPATETDADGRSGFAAARARLAASGLGRPGSAVDPRDRARHGSCRWSST